MSNEGTLLQSEHKLFIDTTPDEATETYSRLGAGLTGFEPDLNEEVAQDFYLDGDGFAESEVTGAQLVISFDGHRKYGDAAQDFIFGQVLKLGKARKTTFKWEQPDGKEITGSCTIANISGPSGESNQKGEISFEIHLNGKPTEGTVSE